MQSSAMHLLGYTHTGVVKASEKIGTDKDIIEGTGYLLDEGVVGKMQQGNVSIVLEIFLFLR